MPGAADLVMAKTLLSEEPTPLSEAASAMGKGAPQ